MSIQYVGGGWGVANSSNFSCTLAVIVASMLPSFNLVFHFCVNILSTFAENGNINIRDELRKLSQQPNRVEQDRLIRGLVRKISLY